jgi:exodeoxyribonuclease VII small subunit
MAKSKKSPDGATKRASGSKDEGFDERLGRLEGLVRDLESGELSLEDAMERFGEGVKLLGACAEALSAYEERVEELSAEAESGLSELRGEDSEE